MSREGETVTITVYVRTEVAATIEVRPLDPEDPGEGFEVVSVEGATAVLTAEEVTAALEGDLVNALDTPALKAWEARVPR